ncbi:hypothetical protein ACHAWO_012222 [Cyclotella atomus]|uniref:Uncharacterized protein n=1 Tax=Cyclotella atomus TaxID=382360 RepID=A0ABD3NF21_9STRA
MNSTSTSPPASAHPAGCIKGNRLCLICRYYAQNTFQRDFVHFAKLYRHFILRGWDRTYIRNLILEACTSTKSKAHTPTAQPTLNQDLQTDVNRLFIHIEYHPEDIPRKRVQALYQLHLGEVLNDELGIERPTIAYSRPKNIGDLITKAKLHQAPGQTSSIILGSIGMIGSTLGLPQIFSQCVYVGLFLNDTASFFHDILKDLYLQRKYPCAFLI